MRNVADFLNIPRVWEVDQCGSRLFSFVPSSGATETGIGGTREVRRLHVGKCCMLCAVCRVVLYEVVRLSASGGSGWAYLRCPSSNRLPSGAQYGV